MNRIFKLIFTFIAILWSSIVVFAYFYYHPEYFGNDKYTSAFKYVNFIWTFWGVLFFFYLGWIIYKASFAGRNTLHFKKLTIAKLWGAFNLLLIFFADYYFVQSSFSKHIGFWSAQISLISKLGLTQAFLLLLSLLSFSAGKKILNLIQVEEKKNFLGDTLLAIATGLGVLMLCSFILGCLGWITFPFLGILTVLILVLCPQEVWLFLRRFFQKTFEFKARYISLEVFFVFVLSFVLVMNMIDLIRPIPIGWDDMGVYLNQPKLIGQGGTLLQGVTNNYFLITSWPFALIRDEYLAGMVGLNFSFWGGFLAILAVGAFVGRFLKQKYAIMSATLMYVIPMTMHQSFADMKTDMLLFFFMIMSTYLYFLWLKTQQNEQKYLILAGLLAGIAFGIKPTAILLIFAVLVGIFYRFWSWQGALGIYLFEWIALDFVHYLRFLNNWEPFWVSVGVWGFLILGLLFLQQGWSGHKNLSSLLKNLFGFTIAVSIAFSPWAFKNLNEHHFTSLNVGTILNGYNEDKAKINYQELEIDKSQCNGTAQKEELGRYLGYDTGIKRYLSLPWKITMNTTVKGFYLDLSFLFLSFAPLALILFFFRRQDSDELTVNWKTLIYMGGTAWLMWIFVGSGVIWYGIFGFILLLPLTTYYFYENRIKILKIIAGIMVILSLVSVVALRGTKFGNVGTIAYAYGLSSGIETLDLIMPDYRQIACIVEGDRWNTQEKKCVEVSQTKDNSPILRIGTFIPYFIARNDVRLFNDPQLDNFSCVDNAFGQNSFTTLRQFKEMGYRYIIFDLNTATIERNSKGTLHQKAKRFVGWLNEMNKAGKIKIHVNNPKKGIAFIEILD